MAAFIARSLIRSQKAKGQNAKAAAGRTQHGILGEELFHAFLLGSGRQRRQPIEWHAEHQVPRPIEVLAHHCSVHESVPPDELAPTEKANPNQLTWFRRPIRSEFEEPILPRHDTPPSCGEGFVQW